ncbi:MAG: hypothetical protein ABI067_08360 [Leifsonia sp.]
MAAPKGNKNAKGNKGGGRKSIYQSDFAEQAFKYALLGASEAQIGEFLGVVETTVEKWKKTHVEFRQALYDGKARADAEIAYSLYHRAKGYSHKDIDIRVIDGKIVQTEITRYYPPDTNAAKIWLHNRQRQLWKQSQGDEDTPPVIITVNVTTEETKKIAADLRDEYLRIA